MRINLLQTINQNKDFRRIYAKGKSFVGPAIVTYISKSRLENTRVGITASKKIGKAVQRNRAKRVIREAYRQVAPEIKGKYDFVFVARTRTTKVKMQDVQEQMRKHLKAGGVL